MTGGRKAEKRNHKYKPLWRFSTFIQVTVKHSVSHVATIDA